MVIKRIPTYDDDPRIQSEKAQKVLEQARIPEEEGHSVIKGVLNWCDEPEREAYLIYHYNDDGVNVWQVIDENGEALDQETVYMDLFLKPMEGDNFEEPTPE